MSSTNPKTRQPACDQHRRLLERLARRYEQLDEELAAIEAKLPEFCEDNTEPTSTHPKPR